ncbi:SDR family NAD(P)-dependent oxidoreductase [Micromonospora sp. CPCC 206061]|uniref:SDR family NAD(P)-dependent oxidoreductase n=1 Tax=Micromonospora sp. CPCC 206061 TaxID=3122410 RepID=UPI002FF00DD9
MRTLAGRTAVVTGGTRGIGRAVSLTLAGAGATVLAGYRADEAAAAETERLLKEHGEGHRTVRADLADPSSAVGFGEECQALGRVDILVNNAGIDAAALFDEVTTSEWQDVLDTNLAAAYRVTQAVLPLLGRGASVVNVGAAVALRGLATRTHYGAAKAGVVGFTRALAKELGPMGVRVNAVAPGVVETEPLAGLPEQIYDRLRAATAFDRLATPAEIAGVVLFLASPLAGYVTGSVVTVDGGI